ncbi:hypothetical protein WN48_01869 [Eufriesea mexicana]|uniref:Uncharacterized protein n=1 Tax=Eufriesea mexicana TaxID=516756 RepID=A0A310SGU3_9HYME|nr:hypothetical protein WN48_01869 [Eufriesea mexicana]
MEREKERKRQLFSRTINPAISYSDQLKGKQTNTLSHSTIPQTPQTPQPSFLEEIRRMTDSINTQIRIIAESVEANTNKINILAESLGIDLE